MTTTALAAATRLFAVTTTGLTATRWLSHVLASHPEVYVAHGKFPLDSIQRGRFLEEKHRASLHSLARGNDLAELYQNHSLEEILEHYERFAPNARCLGSVHSYQVHTLVQSARRPETLDHLNLVNVVRHPISFIDSHFALVRSAEQFPALYQQYLEGSFPEALRQFPELYLMECPHYRDFVAFTVSCRAANHWLLDFYFPGVRHVRMEDLTTRGEVLHETCKDLTGLDYSPDMLEPFLTGGAINQHRQKNSQRDPHVIFESWASWQKDLAHLVLSGIVLEKLEHLGYDLSMLRNAHEPARDRPRAPCLVDQLRALDPRHPHLAFLSPRGTHPLQTLEGDWPGYRLTTLRGKQLALALPLQLRDVDNLDEPSLQHLQEEGQAIRGNSLGEIWKILALRLSGPPQFLQEYRSFNLLSFRGRFFGAAQGIPIDLERLSAPARQDLRREELFFWADSLPGVQEQIDEKFDRVFLEEANYQGFHIYRQKDRWYALPMEEGELRTDRLAQYPVLIEGPNRERIKVLVDYYRRTPPWRRLWNQPVHTWPIRLAEKIRQKLSRLRK